MFQILLFVGLAVASVAFPAKKGVDAPTATIKNGTIVGSTTNNVDSFSGVPYAQPPVANLRLRPPQAIAKSLGTMMATKKATACPQFAFQINTADLPTDTLGYLIDTPLVQAVIDYGEDCLTVDIQRPAGTTSDSKLPVLFWIYGGGFEAGWSGMYDGSKIVRKSADLGKPIIYVAVNYRLGAFGFLAGSELAKEGSTNLGLRDQRLALQWVQENIAAFGGDPKRVTLWGESAGSISACYHTIINGGDNTYNGNPLFRAVIMDSGSIIPADPVTAPQAETIYSTVVQNAKCSEAPDKLACLRSVNFRTLLNAGASVPGIFNYPSLDLSYLPRPDPGDRFFPLSPEVPLRKGQFTKVPVIIGDQQDEGTLFSLVQTNVTTNSDLIEYFATYFPGNAHGTATVTEFVAHYPDQPFLGQPAGSPFNTGPLNNIYPQYKRLAAILGDLVFTLTRRAYLSFVTEHVNAWSYLSTYFHGLPVLGTFHVTDILHAFGDLPGAPTDSIMTYYISFVNELNPNALGDTALLVPWPQWNNTMGSPDLLNFGVLGNSLLPDTFRQSAFEYLLPSLSKFRF